MKTLVLGVDCATTTGWGITSPDFRSAVYGIIKYRNMPQYLGEVQALLQQVKDGHEADYDEIVVAIERPFAMKKKLLNKRTNQMEEKYLIQPFGALKRLCAVWEVACVAVGFVYIEAEPATWRAATIGKRYVRAARTKCKAAAIGMARIIWRKDIPEDAAEALCLSMWGHKDVGFRRVVDTALKKIPKKLRPRKK